jgi:hypothetical protein
MRRATNHISINTVRADALFVSALQRADDAGAERIQAAVVAAVRAFGSRGCAARVAQEFGDHPDLAAARMRWARQLIDRTYRGPGAPVDAGRLATHRHPVAAARAA